MARASAVVSDARESEEGNENGSRETAVPVRLSDMRAARLAYPGRASNCHYAFFGS